MSVIKTITDKNIEQLEKLTELKTKGIVTQEQYDAEKKKILYGTTNDRNVYVKLESINWWNALYACVATSVPLLFLAIFFGVGMNVGNFVPFFVCLVIEALIFLFCAQKKQTYLYKNCLTTWVLFALILISGPIAMCIALYQFYQIDDELADLK